MISENSTLNQQALSSFLWSVADLLRGDYRQSDYGKIISAAVTGKIDVRDLVTETEAA
jgi:type I restriction-modification system DNA methylase subunit